MITNPKVYLTWEKGWDFFHHFQSSRIESKLILKGNTLTSTHEYFHRANCGWRNTAAFDIQRRKQWRWLCYLKFAQGGDTMNCYLTAMTEMNPSWTALMKSFALDDYYGLNSANVIRHMSVRQQKDVDSCLPHCGSFTVVFFRGQVLPEQAESTSLAGQKEHKKAVLPWVCRRVTGTGSVTGEESTKCSQERLTEHFLVSFNSVIGWEKFCRWRNSSCILITLITLRRKHIWTCDTWWWEFLKKTNAGQIWILLILIKENCQHLKIWTFV